MTPDRRKEAEEHLFDLMCLGELVEHVTQTAMGEGEPGVPATWMRAASRAVLHLARSASDALEGAPARPG